MKKDKGYLYVFLITFFILCLALLLLKCSPFGNRTIIVSDLRDQYISFINYIKTIFTDGNNFFYSFSGSLGINMFALSGYYLVSLFNFFTIFVSTENMYTALTLIILIKLSLCSSSFYYFLTKKYGNIKINYLFSLCYGLMSYNLAFYFHIMWLDSIILMPLMLLGIENIFNKHNSRLYLISLALIIISNYYMGIITCLFSIIYFVYYYIINLNAINDKRLIIKKYCISSLLAGLIGSFILIPEIMALSYSKVALGGDVVVPTTYNILEILSKLINSPFTANQIWHGAPNIFAGTFITILVILYFCNGNISKKKRIINFCTCLIILLTFVIRPLNLIFHGLSEPNCFDYRHAFILTFFLLIIAYDSYDGLSTLSFKKKSVILGFLLFFYIFVFIEKYSWFNGFRGLFLVFSLLVSMLLLILFNKKNSGRYFLWLIVIVILDLFVNVTNTIGTTTIYEKDSSRLNDYKNYVTDNEQVLSSLKNIDNSLYRLEKDYHYSSSINDSMLFGYNGISHFDSTSNFKTESFLRSLGFRQLISRSDYGLGSTAPVDTLLGIKYVLSHSDSYKDYHKIISQNSINIFQSKHYLGMGYGINNADDIEFTFNTFDNINSIYRNITGINSNVYYSSEYKVNYHNVLQEDNFYRKTGNDSYIEFIVKVTSNDTLYMTFSDNMIRSKFPYASLYINDTFKQLYFDKYNYGVIDIGKYSIGETISLKFYITNSYKYLKYNDVFLYYEDSKAFEKMYALLEKETINFKKVSSSHLEGSINLKDHSNILLSIPYEKGFIVKVDGEVVDYHKIYDSLITISIIPGSHVIDITYVPSGLKMGIIVSGISFLLSFLYLKKEKLGKNV